MFAKAGYFLANCLVFSQFKFGCLIFVNYKKYQSIYFHLFFNIQLLSRNSIAHMLNLNPSSPTPILLKNFATVSKFGLNFFGIYANQFNFIPFENRKPGEMEVI